ncbi:MAG: GHKL domain-containing protein [Clostridia bacterium]|nr:GHKL domain-containing protein [Clostridia bacterium]
MDAFLFSRTEELKTQGYEIQTQVRVPARAGIPDADMVVAFGNLLDNAVEACPAAGRKQITLSAHMEKGYLHIEERNPAPAAPTSRKRRIPELERGIGFHILQELAGRYDGSFAASVEQGDFTASLILKGAAEV